MSYTSNTQTEIWVAGTTGKIYQVDLVNGKLLGSFDYDCDILYMDTNLRYVLLGRGDGSVDVIDPKPQRIQHTFRCHSASLSCMAVHERTLLTTGYSLKKDQFVADPLVNVYSVDTMTSSNPLAFPAGPTHVFVHPLHTDLALIASHSGQFHFVDTTNSSRMQIYQADISSYITLMDFAPSGQVFVFVDSMQVIHLWARMPPQMSQLPSFAVYATPVEVPTADREQPPPECIPQFGTYLPPLNGLKLPHYDEMLLSAWPPEMVFQVGVQAKPIDEEIQRGQETIRGFQISHYNKDKFGSRNVVSRYEKTKKLTVPKFISEQENDDEDDDYEDEDADPRSNKDLLSTSNENGEVPNAFRPVRIALSKFGVDDFDFAFYNSTPYSGLENQDGNCYINCVLQLYRFCPPLCNYILGNLSHDVTQKNLLLVELGYLYDMLLKANGRHCAASNFQRVFASIPETKMLGLIDDNGKKYDDIGQRRLIQTFNRFMLERMAQDERTLLGTRTSEKLDAIAGLPTETAIFSNFCSLSQKRTTVFHSMDVNSLPVPPAVPSNLTILNYIEASLNKKVEHTVTCDTCKKEHAIDASLRVGGFPPLMILNIDLSNEQLNEIRFLKGWLVPEFYVTVSSTGLPTLRTNVIAGNMGMKKYELVSYVAQVTDRFGRNQLVTISRGTNEVNRRGGVSDTKSDGWYLLNDYLVTPLPEEEVFDVSRWWKRPVIVTYRSVTTPPQVDCQIWRPFDDSILYKDHFAKGTREGKIVEYELLTRDEAPRPGTLVAIDAEFVQLSPPEYEVSFHKQKRVVRPKLLALGRISVLRGEGPQEGKCFIDDYIVATEHIDDYITSFSGIEPGDLDPHVSKRTVVTLQTAYRKMWLLLNLGCIFVGHSLKGDFRMIDIKVPPQQIHDTAELFYLKRQKRKLSLKFLVYQLFHDNVQTGNHDSIEDADSALRCYRKYLELERTGTLDSTLQNIYLEGSMSRFRIP